MRHLIENALENCVGCNRCVRVCPIEEANITTMENGRLVVRIDHDKCIACSACQEACHHNSRYYEDDTERFFNDLQSGTKISVFAAPAIRTNFPEWEKMLTWLKELGAISIYDVSLGADICTWAHIRYIQKNNPPPIISQPCPAIVNYVLMHKNELLPHLSPVHSPMLCTAVYMREYEGINHKIAALSPCVAKAHEFDATGIVHYNVTFKHLQDYIEKNRVHFPAERGGFDHFDAGLGGLYPMPGGLKECVEHYIGKSLRVDKSEGPSMVYKALDEYAGQPDSKLPALFDVLNCAEGCNAGTGCNHVADVFEINTMMDDLRQTVTSSEEHRAHLDELFRVFDESLHLEDFIREYRPVPVRKIPINSADIEDAFLQLNKRDEVSRKFDCGACGCNTCREMVEKIAKGLNIPQNCTIYLQEMTKQEHEHVVKIQKDNMDELEKILEDTNKIKDLTEGITDSVKSITGAIETNAEMVKEIEKIARQVNIIAINASVEAARAGEHGKAFAVVAEEIRKLAQDTAASAQKTKDSSEIAVSAIETVNEFVGKIGESVGEFYNEVSEITENTKNMLNEEEQ